MWSDHVTQIANFQTFELSPNFALHFRKSHETLSVEVHYFRNYQQNTLTNTPTPLPVLIALTPCIMCVLYIGGVQYIGGYHEYIGGIHEYIGGCSVHRGDIMMNVGGNHEYIGGCSVHRRDTMSTSGGYHEYIGGIS